VIVITGFGSLESAIGAIRAGAFDFLTKPIDTQALRVAVDRAAAHSSLRAEVRRLRRAVERVSREGPLVGESPRMRKVYEMIERVADSDATVLITGESGTGKELVARALHNRSPRSKGRYLAVNCAAVPPNLLESELFGHVRGAFTDAKSDREGLFVRASGGTLLLDEIGEMPPEMQAKLLRVLQEAKVRPVGGDREIPFDVRILAATNRDLEEDVEVGRFREDLFYRINVVNIDVPPLRDRGNDVLLLAHSFIERLAARASNGDGDRPEQLDPRAAQKLVDYDWPGNVRELENCIERAVTLSRGPRIEVEDLPDKIREHPAQRWVLHATSADEIIPLRELEKRYIRRVLEATGGNKAEAARLLGLDRRTLYRKLERLVEDIA
jgi:two-component system response regulator HydG